MVVDGNGGGKYTGIVGVRASVSPSVRSHGYVFLTTTTSAHLHVRCNPHALLILWKKNVRYVDICQNSIAPALMIIRAVPVRHWKPCPCCHHWGTVRIGCNPYIFNILSFITAATLWVSFFRTHPRRVDCTWWRHQMETFSALLVICAGNSPVPVNFLHKGQWRGTLMFSLICVWINSWENNREAGDLRRNRAHYDVIVMNSTTMVSPLTHGMQPWWYSCHEP